MKAVVIHKEHNVYVPELIFGTILSGSNYDKDEKKAMTQQKRKAEKDNPKSGKGNKPTMTHFDEATDAVVHSHVFEHIYEPVSFLNTIRNKIAKDTIHFFSVPNLQKYLDLNLKLR